MFNNWLRRAQVSSQAVLMAVVNGQSDVRKAYQELSRIDNPAQFCDEVTALFAAYPQATRPLSQLSRLLGCADIIQGQVDLPYTEEPNFKSLDIPTEQIQE